MTVEQAEQKVKDIYNTIKSNSGKIGGEYPIVVVRTKHAITFSIIGCKPIQVILRVYKSPAEILIGFDIDSCVSTLILVVPL